LNFEATATAVIAALVFREAIGARIWAAISCITLAVILLSLNPAGGWGFSIGALGVIAACTLWGVDNNLTRNISAKDPVMIVAWKGVSAGSFTLLITLALGVGFPALSSILRCMLLGALSIGLSLVLFILAMRNLGTARTTALFGSAPFMGAILSWFIFHEALSGRFYIAATMMIVGVVLLVGEKHNHEHEHGWTEHEHRHRHDDSHHSHVPPDDDELTLAAHAHPHIHEPVRHSHPHTPDIDHRHTH